MGRSVQDLLTEARVLEVEAMRTDDATAAAQLRWEASELRRKARAKR